MEQTELVVVDAVPDSRFVMQVDGYEAELVYRVDGDRLILVHTGVPDELGGHGIGGLLVAAAVERAARTGETIVPQCPYARSWLKKHEDIARTVSIDWTSRPS